MVKEQCAGRGGTGDLAGNAAGAGRLQRADPARLRRAVRGRGADRPVLRLDHQAAGHGRVPGGRVRRGLRPGAAGAAPRHLGRPADPVPDHPGLHHCTLAATLLHLDRFHFGSEFRLARFAAWFWLAIYVVVPLAMVVVLVVPGAVHAAGADHRPLPIPRLVRLLLAVQGACCSASAWRCSPARPPGRALAVDADPADRPMVAAWLLGFGSGAVLAGREGDLARLDVAARRTGCSPCWSSWSWSATRGRALGRAGDLGLSRAAVSILVSGYGLSRLGAGRRSVGVGPNS